MEEIETSNEELKTLIKDGHFFMFCVSFALNEGYRNAIKDKKEVTFSVGEYEVKFDPEQMCFILIHKVYFLRIIHAYYQEVIFTAFTEQELIDDLLLEFEKDVQRKILSSGT